MIDTQLITKLRHTSGAGIADCKSALEEAGSDIDKALEILRKSGAVKAAKKAERETKEGVISITVEGNKTAIVGLACETDFVARNEDFVKAVDDFSHKLLELGLEEFKLWAEAKIKDELIVRIGENIQLAQAEIVEGEVVNTYLHSNKKVAAVVSLTGGTKELAADLAMQVTAMSPQYVKPEDISAVEIEKEKEIYKEQLKAEGKPEEMWEKILPGKLNKYYEEVCLIKQAFIKDDKVKVEELLKEAGENVEVIKFARYTV